MPSTYTQNLGIEKPGTGEQTGTWGDTVNLNYDMFDRAINGVKSLSLTGSSSTLTTSDGALSDGQYKLFLLGGTPSGTHTITISPNDAQKVYFVTNSSGESVIFTQGSGTTATITNGSSAVIYADGGGASANVTKFAPTDFTSITATSTLDVTGATTLAATTISGLTQIAPASGGGEVEIVSSDNTSTSTINFSDSDAADRGFVRYDHADDELQFGANAHQYLHIGGDATTVFQWVQPAGYDNTTFWTWDGGKSTGNSSYLVINGANDGEMGILFGDDDDTADGWVRYDNATRNLIFGAANSNQARITSAGKFGIGTSDPSALVEIVESSSGRSWAANSATELLVERGGDCFITIAASAGSNSTLNFGDHADENVGRIQYEHTGNTMRFVVDTGTRATLTSTGLTVNGSLSKSSGSFRIDHPLKPDTHHLVHSFVEAPQADNIYRGRVDLVNGQATVNLDEAARMTEGTFVALNGNIQCFTSNETGWTAVRGTVDGNILTIEAQSPVADTVSWLVIGERHDQHMIDTPWTDENGRVITEPVKE